MKSLLASIFRAFFKINSFKKHFYGVHKKIFIPFNLLKGVSKTIVFRKGIKLQLKIEDWIQENLYFLGEYETVELNFIESRLKKGDTFIDIGTNIGVHSLFASTLVGNDGKVISFEPFSLNHNAFKRNIELNKLTNIQPEKLAVSHKEGVLELFYNEKESNLGMTSAYTSDYTKKEAVRMISLDDYVQENQIQKIDFIKLDIEGGEFLALQGMTRVLSDFSPILMIEILKEELENKSRITAFLAQFGYEIFTLEDDTSLSKNEAKEHQINFVFVKR